MTSLSRELWLEFLTFVKWWASFWSEKRCLMGRGIQWQQHVEYTESASPSWPSCCQHRWPNTSLYSPAYNAHAHHAHYLSPRSLRALTITPSPFNPGALQPPPPSLPPPPGPLLSPLSWPFRSSQANACSNVHDSRVHSSDFCLRPPYLLLEGFSEIRILCLPLRLGRQH